MQPSRIARELITSGFDPSIHLAIAQHSLTHIQDLQSELPAMEQELKDMARVLQQQQHAQDTGGLMERLDKLGNEFMKLKRELEGAGKETKVLEVDVRVLKRYFAALEGEEVQGDGKVPRRMSLSSGGILQTGHDKHDS
ncbi:MAG: hypothetical protein Q9220_005723 [cf. Caloplaca sp. 1 TL-2023]